MTTPNEFTLVEKPILDTLTDRYNYHYIHPDAHPTLRSGENEVLFRPHLIQALIRINNIPESDAKAIFKLLGRRLRLLALGRSELAIFPPKFFQVLSHICSCPPVSEIGVVDF